LRSSLLRQKDGNPKSANDVRLPQNAASKNLHGLPWRVVRKVKIPVVLAAYQTRYGDDVYCRPIPEGKTSDDVIEDLKKEVGYDENSEDEEEFFDVFFDELTIDTDEFPNIA
jgi:hypothetical protein